MARTPAERMAEAARHRQLTDDAQRAREDAEANDRAHHAAGYRSNQRIVQRIGGVRPQFLNDIGGCSDNYR